MTKGITLGSEKLAISLPANLVEMMEKLREKTGESRSAFIRRAIIHLIQTQARKQKVESYVRGYSDSPESKEEIKAAESSAAYLLAEEPWE